MQVALPGRGQQAGERTRLPQRGQLGSAFIETDSPLVTGGPSSPVTRMAAMAGAVAGHGFGSARPTTYPVPRGLPGYAAGVGRPGCSPPRAWPYERLGTITLRRKMQTTVPSCL